LNPPEHIAGIGRYPSGTVGTAFDYRLRYLLRHTAAADLLAAAGARNAARILGASPGDLPPAFTEVAVRLAELAPKLRPGQQLQDAVERELIKLCYVLALYEQCYRTRPSPSWPLLQAGLSAPLEQVLQLCPTEAIEDLRALTAAAVADLASDLTAAETVLNPQFAGSRHVGGADADLIVGRRLIEAKTTADANKALTAALRQVVGYVLLDLDDTYRLERVSLYFPRYRRVLTWPLQRLLDTAAGYPVELREVRADLAERFATRERRTRELLDRLREERDARRADRAGSAGEPAP
jgi:hypothetical protein